MAGRREVRHQQLVGAAVGRVVDALAALVLDDVALVVQLLLVGLVEQRRQAVGLDPQQRLEVGRRHGREVVGAVAAGGAVDAALTDVRAHFLDQREVLAGHVRRALEHQVLEQVGEAGPSRHFVLRADVEPLVHVDDRQLAIDVQDQLQAVRQHVLFERDLRRRRRHRCRDGSSRWTGRWDRLGRRRGLAGGGGGGLGRRRARRLDGLSGKHGHRAERAGSRGRDGGDGRPGETSKHEVLQRALSLLPNPSASRCFGDELVASGGYGRCHQNGGRLRASGAIWSRVAAS